MPKVDLREYVDGPILEGEFRDEDVSHAMVRRKPETDPWMIKQLLKEPIQTIGDLVVALYKLAPTTDADLPLFFYRVDFIPFEQVREILNSDESLGVRGKELENLFGPAIVQLQYDEGFPTLPNGKPIWEKFEFEPIDAYHQFSKYINDGPNRAIYKLIEFDSTLVAENAKQYYWTTRIRAFDIYRVAYHEKVRLHRALNAEDNHYNMAAGMLKSIGDYLGTLTASDLSDLGPKEAVGIMEKLVKIQRDAVGLNNPKAYEDRLQAPTMGKLVHKVSRAERVERVETDDAAHIVDDLSAIEMAQELIIKVQTSKDNGGTSGKLRNVDDGGN